VELLLAHGVLQEWLDAELLTFEWHHAGFQP
jgi:hypothetical protein